MITTLWSKLIRFGFRLLYYELAWTYDVVSWLVSLGNWQNWQKQSLPFIQGKDVLEIGHGPGHMLLALHEAGYQVVGLDLSPNMGRLAKRRQEDAGGVISLVRGDVETMPLATAVFDTVLATFPTEYVISPNTLAAVNRILRSNGRFVIIPEAHLTGNKILGRFIEWLYTITGQRSGAFTVDQGVDRPQDGVRQSIGDRFVNAGFRMEINQIQLSNSQVTVLAAHKDVG